MCIMRVFLNFKIKLIGLLFFSMAFCNFLLTVIQKHLEINSLIKYVNLYLRYSETNPVCSGNIICDSKLCSLLFLL
jgi:hypothetical protein